MCVCVMFFHLHYLVEDSSFLPHVLLLAITLNSFQQILSISYISLIMFDNITISWFFFSFKNYLLNSHCGIWGFDYSFPYLLPTKILSPLLSRMTIHYLLLDQCSSPCDIIIATKILQLSHLINYDLFYLIYIFVDSRLFCFLSLVI